MLYKYVSLCLDIGELPCQNRTLLSMSTAHSIFVNASLHIDNAFFAIAIPNFYSIQVWKEIQIFELAKLSLVWYGKVIFPMFGGTL